MKYFKFQPEIDSEANCSSIRSSAFARQGTNRSRLAKDRIRAFVESKTRFRRFLRFAPDFLETPSDLPVLEQLKGEFFL
jgi:hypothetical protein